MANRKVLISPKVKMSKGKIRGLTKRLMAIIFCISSVLVDLAMAGSFTVTPIKLYLSKERKTTTIRVKNNAKEKVTVQVRGVSWSQDEDGKDRFEPTKEIVFFPKIFPLEPEEERILCLGYQGEWPGVEKTYRIFLDELPVKRPGKTGLKMALSIGIPVFISPINRIKG